MTEVYLFDWGDTLMVDFPGIPGKMCDWEEVEAVEGAEDALREISKEAKIYIATGAAESTEKEIETAFKRVNLAKYIAGYFCKANLGIEKGGPAFLSSILSKLGKEANQVTMVGDNFKKDIEPAIALGIHAIWLSKDTISNQINGVRVISSLQELC
jgi:FMN phosphatase YigB (HAD superfamily)